MAANSIDHVPPRVARATLVAQGLVARYPFIEVHCCVECNSTLGARPLWTLGARKRYIKQALRRRYGAILRLPNWTDAELAQMSDRMRDYILDGLKVRDFIEARISF